MIFLRRAVLALVSGALLSLAFPPISLWPFVAALAPVVVLSVNSSRARDAFWPGFFFALGFFALHLLWLPQSFAEASGGFFWLLYPPLLAVLGVFWGVVTFAARRLGGRGVGALWLLPALWVVMEWARTQGPFAFPWGVIGYVWVGTPLAQAADLAGVYGLSLMTLAALSLAVSPFVYHPRGRLTPRLAWFCGLLVVALWLGYGTVRLRTVTPDAPLTAVLVQGSTDPYERANSLEGVNREISLYADLTVQALGPLDTPPALVVWPEGVVLDGSIGNGREVALNRSVRGAPLITGAASYDAATGENFNSVYSLSDARVLGRFDKRYLVPFGEYFPLTSVLRPVYSTVFGWFGLEFYQGRTPGAETVPLELPGSQAGAYICYESVFPQIARTMTARGARVLVNVSNDAWFGFGGGARQHFYMGTLRAIETRRYLLRGGNDGVTAAVDPLGRTLAELPRGERGALTVRYGRRSGLTPYVRFGDLLIAGLVLYTGVVVWIRWRRLGSAAFS